MRPDFNTIKPDIFRGESGGDYNALFNYQNRPGGLFDDVKITDMTVDAALEFAQPRSGYGNYVKMANPEGVVATPMGAYQVVGTTLRDAKRGLGLRGDELMTRELQDRIGKYIYDTQGTGAWAGYKGPAYGPANAKQEAAPMLPRQPQAPRGLLEQFGLQKMQPGAAGETGQKFYQRDSFKDLAGRFAVGLNSMKLRPDPNFAGMMEGRRQERTQKNSRNKTVEYLRANGMSQYADMVEAGQLPASQVLGAIMQQSMATPKQTAQIQNYEYWKSQGLSDEDARALVQSGNSINMPGPESADAVLRKQMMEKQGESFNAMMDAGSAAANAAADLQTLQQLAPLAPTGPLAGRFAEAFPEFNDVSALRQSIIKRIAPTLRVEGSGATSDLEFNAMLNSLGSLKNTPEANMAIIAVMQAKAEMNIKKKSIIREYSKGPEKGITFEQAIEQLEQVESVSTIPQAVQNILNSFSGAAEPMTSQQAEDLLLNGN